jgi:hypothetical protein
MRVSGTQQLHTSITTLYEIYSSAISCRAAGLITPSFSGDQHEAPGTPRDPSAVAASAFGALQAVSKNPQACRLVAPPTRGVLSDRRRGRKGPGSSAGIQSIRRSLRPSSGMRSYSSRAVQLTLRTQRTASGMDRSALRPSECRALMEEAH